MGYSDSADTVIKVFYQPIEAAIRWCELVDLEPLILDYLDAGKLPEQADIPQWSQLRLNLARIHDALVNGDLRYGKRGITCDDPDLLLDPDLTIRHVDLKSWMRHFYPDQRPSFLFDSIKRHLHPAINIDAVQVLIADREALKIQLADRAQAWDAMQAELEVLNAYKKANAKKQAHPAALGQRSEGTYLNIVGGLLTLMLGKSPSGTPNSSSRSQEAVVNALTAHFGDRSGMSERTLWSKFAGLPHFV